MRRLVRSGVSAMTVVTLVWMAACSGDPLATELPGSPQDIATVQSQLDQLSAEERQLVVDYLNRSKGDVLPASAADPDAPLTARTFREAIRLQREFNARHAEEAAQREAVQASREAAMQPLRQALQVELLQRDITTADQASGREPAPGEAINTKPVVITTYRLRNNGVETITQVSGSVTIRSMSDPESLLGLASCFISRTAPIEPGQWIDVRCGNLAKEAGARDEEYAAMSERDLILNWEPQSITFASGEELRAAQ